MVGMVCTAIFARDVGLVHGNVTTLLFHLLALAIVSCFTFFGSYVLYKIADAVSPLRVTTEQEELGLDLSQHGEAVA
jgi:Amt family ammonium transporter